MLKLQNLSNEEASEQLLKTVGSPEILLLILTLLYFVLISFLANVKINGVDLASWYLFGMKEIGFVKMSILSIVFSITFYVYLVLVRLFIRKAKKMEAFESKKALKVETLNVTSWMLFVFFAALFSFYWSYFAWTVSDSFGILIIGVFGTLCILSYTQAYLYFVCNEFDYT